MPATKVNPHAQPVSDTLTRRSPLEKFSSVKLFHMSGGSFKKARAVRGWCQAERSLSAEQVGNSRDISIQLVNCRVMSWLMLTRHGHQAAPAATEDLHHFVH